LDQGSALLTPIRLWRERLAARLVTAVLAMSLVTAVLRTSYDFEDSARALDAQVASTGSMLANQLAVYCQDKVLTADYQEMEDFAEYLLKQTSNLTTFVRIAHLRIERNNGQVLNPRTAPDPEALAAPDLRTFEAPVVLPDTDHVLGRCTIWLDVAPARAELRERSLRALVQNGIAFTALVVLMTILLRVWLGRPLSQLDDAVQRIATGDLDATLPPTGVGELRRFARTLESMRESLRDSHASLARQNEQLRTLDRLKDEFLANTSHEIRTPLSSILGSLELLDDADAGERAELQDAMQRNGAHLLFLINQVLDFTKLQAGNLAIELQSVAARPLLDDVVSCLRPQAKERKLELAFEWGPDAPEHVQTDPLRLRQILINLAGNALKFTAAGSVRVSAQRRTASAGDELEIAITDTGPGISEAAQKRLFVPFAQGDASLSRRHGGTGLGLVISRRLAHALGGDIALTSTVGVGTRVVVTIPVGVAPMPAAPVLTPTVGAATAAAAAAAVLVKPALLTPVGGRVLLVDDAPDNRRLLSTMLRKAGVDVTTAEDGERGCQSVAAAAANGLQFDLVLMDIQMPVLDGHQATRRLRKQGFTLPIVALTAHATENDRTACLEAGFDEYASKPISRAQLTDLVSRYVRHDRS
jgi:signal transduction histidine kinase/ActR/RegA family two-component response regulator